jgi:hypothetical protein
MLWQSRARLPSNHRPKGRARQPSVAAYSRTGTHISSPPLPVSGSNFSSYRSKVRASAAFCPEAGSQ